jgi:hypothetical protein
LTAGSSGASGPEVRWLRSWSVDGRVVLRIGRAAEELVADWVGSGMLRSNRAGTRSVFTSADGESHDGGHGSYATGAWNGCVDPYLRHLRAKMTLHAAGVRFGSRAVAFAGRSGAGKSTMAAALCRTEGIALLADDTLALERAGAGFEVLPTEARHRLREDSARHFGFPEEHAGKGETPAERVASTPVELRAIVMLAPDESASAPAMRRLSGRQAFTAVAGQLFRFVLDEPEVDLRDFELVSDVVRAVPVYELTRTGYLSKLDASVKLVVRELAVAGIVE